MVGRIPKRQVVAETLASDFSGGDTIQETPQERQARIVRAMENAQSLVGDIASGNRMTRQIAKDDQVMRKAYRKAVTEGMSLADLAYGLDSGPGLSMQDVMLPDMPMPRGREFLTEEFPTNHDDMIMNEYYRDNSYAKQEPPRQTRPRQVLTENQPTRPSPPARSIRETLHTEGVVKAENWRVKRYLGETRSGTEVHIWKVENTKTGSSMKTMFRIEGVASRIAMMLNESGDNNDPRVISLVSAYEKRDRLLKEARTLEKTADGKAMKTDRLRQIRAEINQLEYRLGV